MTIPYVSIIDPSVLESIDSLGKTIDETVHPQKAFQTAMRNALVTHPELIQQIGNLAKRSPEAVKRLYGTRMADYFAAVGQAPEDAASQAQGTLQATTTGGVNTAISTMTPERRTALSNAGAERALSGGLSSGDIARQERADRTLGAFNQFVTSNQTATPQEIVNKIRNRDPSITPDIAEGAFQSPLYSRLLQNAEDGDRMMLQERLFNARDARQVAQSRDLVIEQTARQLMLKSNSSNLPAWKEVVANGENSADVLKARAKEKEKRSPEEQALVDAADNLQRMNREDRFGAVLPILNQVRQNTAQVSSVLASKTLTNDEKTNQLSALATSLNTGFSAAGLPIKAHFTPYVDNWGPSNTDAAITYTSIGQDGKESPMTSEAVDQAMNRTVTGTVSPEQATGDPMVTAAINAIRNNQASLNDVEGATKYSPAQKAAIRAAFATGR